jgi:small-conductance mechanosensitive channel
MQFITIVQATQRYNKSLSTIKKAISHAKASDKRKGKKLNTGLHKVLISVSFFDGLFLNHSEPTNNRDKTERNDYIKTIKDQLINQQKTIDKLLHNQENLIENERNFQVLLERSNQRADLLESHFNRNRKLNPIPEDETIIEDVINETSNEVFEDSKFIDGTDKSFNDWMATLKKQ